MKSISYVRHDGTRCVRSCADTVSSDDVADFEASMGYRIAFLWETKEHAEMRDRLAWTPTGTV